MAICLGKNFSFGVLCVSFVNVYQTVCVLLYRFGFEGRTWDLIVLIRDHCLTIQAVQTFYFVQP